MHSPFISLTIALISGVLLGRAFLYFPFSIGIFILLSVPTSAIFFLRSGRAFRGFFVIAIPCLVGMAAYLYSAAWFPSDHYTRLIGMDKTVHTITGRVSSPLDRDPERTGFVLSVQRIDNMPASGNIRVSVPGGLISVGYGDSIRIAARLYAPRSYRNPGGFDYADYLARSGIYATAWIKDSARIDILQRGSGPFRLIQDQRERMRQMFLSATNGPGSAVLQAMVLGEEGGLTDELRDRFMSAGVTHIISISGSHLGMLAFFCFALIRGMLLLLPERRHHTLTLHADPKKIAVLVTLPLLVFYTLLAGGQVATVRSLIMISAGLLALLVDREHAILHSLALAGALILLADPQALFDISFQLSFISVLVIGSLVMLWSELPFKAKTLPARIRNNAVLLLGISLVTSLATGPLVAYYFNQSSLTGILSNMVIVPFAGMIVVPLGLVSGVVSLFTSDLLLAHANQFAADGFVRLVTFFSRSPFEFHPPAPGILWLLCHAVFFVSLGSYARAYLLARFKPFETSLRAPRNAVAGMILSGVLLAALSTLPFLPGRGTVVSFPDVGQGDCSLIRLASGKTILIDGGGTRDNRFDIGRRVLAPYLWNQGIRRLDLVILSHPHPDHMNGLISIMNKFPIAEVWESGLDPDLPGHEEFRQILARRNIPLRIVSADGPPVMLGDAELRILHPGRWFRVRDRQAYIEENNRSLVIKVNSEGKSLLFTGDIGKSAEQALSRDRTVLKTDLLKVPHHGSKSSSSDAFVHAARPEVAVVTVGQGNLYHHPADEVIARYEGIGAKIARTDQDGEITVRILKNRLETRRWQDLLMKPIEIRDRSVWKMREHANVRRLLIRTAAF